MKYKNTMACLGLIASFGTGQAATFFTNANMDNDWSNAGNWDNGLPDGSNDARVNNGHTANIGAAVNGGKPIIGGSSTGIVNVNTGKLSGSDIVVGDGSGGVGILNIASGTTLEIAGAGADLIIGRNGGYGTVDVYGYLDARKATEIRNGMLIMRQGSTHNAIQDEFDVRDTGVMVFETNGTIISTLNGSSVLVELASDSTLDMRLGGVYSVGDTWTIMNGITSFGGVGDDGDGQWGTVYNSTNAGHEFTVHYNDDLGADAGTMVVELTAIPEPSTSALIGLAGISLILRRRM
ncbi:PEP-CTERM sorting domain-containing protein [Verrucomicrobiaceae bacterium N1E253]|uniref:PEP-CTERM sorting domain-containing protein n=1 Tax=Oceaniferula marina TaxID=2748318 RepID=A0A851GM37_9BACT|nr:PEP-CTERM sorting domain-containing protein [Oceaniferula marina]NWK55860.1 PEP-CTERM sorting domain-containing protein [Oceaniferula marina]